MLLLNMAQWLLLRASTVSSLANAMDGEESVLLGLQAVVDARGAASHLEDDPLCALMGADSGEALESVGQHVDRHAA